MRRISPSGVASALVVTIVAGVCIRLGFWQLDRLEQRRTLNAAVASAMSSPPLDLSGPVYDSIVHSPDRYLYRRAHVAGHFQLGGELLLRGRAQDGRPGVHLVAPLRIQGGEVVLVNRGWVPSPDAATVDPRLFRTAESVRIEGILQAVPQVAGEAAPVDVRLPDTVVTTYRRLDHAAASEAVGALLPPLYLQELPTPGGRRDPPLPVPPPSLDDGPHLGYAVQWFSFAVVAIVGFGTVVVLRSRKRP